MPNLLELTHCVSNHNENHLGQAKSTFFGRFYARRVESVESSPRMPVTSVFYSRYTICWTFQNAKYQCELHWTQKMKMFSAHAEQDQDHDFLSIYSDQEDFWVDFAIVTNVNTLLIA